MTAKRVLVVDYGRGNLLSLERALAKVGALVTISADPALPDSAERLILPGVGAFGDGMDGLRTRGLVEPLRRFCASGRPFLGICLGMQLLMNESSEFGRHEGLGLIDGKVPRFSDPPGDVPGYKIPHMGWNKLSPARPLPLFSGLGAQPWVYFVHSYYVQPERNSDCAATAPFAGVNFCAALQRDNIHGVQFHPEKSGETGLALLERWLSL